MKKLPIYFTLIVALSSLVGCSKNPNKMRLTYGVLLNENEQAALIDISYNELVERMDPEGEKHDENFLIATYDKDSMCSCWSSHFEPALLGLVKKHNYRVYTIANQIMGEKTYGIDYYLNMSKPTLAIVEGGKIRKQYKYNTSSAMFSKTSALKNELDKYVLAPNMYQVSLDYLDEQIKSEDKLGVYYGRASCPDCSYVEPNVVWPFLHKNEINTKFLFVDLDPLRSQCIANQNMKPYNDFKKDHLMALEDNPTPFGYESGVFPTFQYYEKGELKSASVYVNDVLTKQEDETYKVTQSFYSETRKQYLDYLDDVETTVLEGLIQSGDDISEYGSWLHDSAAKYHNPLLNAFLNKHIL